MTTSHRIACVQDKHLCMNRFSKLQASVATVLIRCAVEMLLRLATQFVVAIGAFALNVCRIGWNLIGRRSHTRKTRMSSKNTSTSSFQLLSLRTLQRRLRTRRTQPNRSLLEEAKSVFHQQHAHSSSLIRPQSHCTDALAKPSGCCAALPHSGSCVLKPRLWRCWTPL